MPGRANNLPGPERIETVVVGGGQAGLAVGYHLSRRGLPFVILERGERIGGAWRTRWDSLRLFTPARYNALPGLPFPGPGHSFSTKDEVADYLEAYAARFELPVRTGVCVNRLSANGSGFVIEADGRRLEAKNVVVAMATHQRPWIPSFADEVDPGITQLHSSDYRNPSQLQPGGVLVVGAGNSGAEIAVEVVKERPTWLAGKETGHVPFRLEGAAARSIALPLMFRFVGHRVLTVRTPIGRRLRPKLLSHGAPLVRVRPKDLAAAGVERVPRVVGVRNGAALLEGDRVLQARNIIWCTGFRPDFSWIDVPVFGDEQEPREPLHERGIVAGHPGLYFVGLFFLYAMSSGFLPGVGRDAEHVAKHIASGRHVDRRGLAGTSMRADLAPAERGYARALRAKDGSSGRSHGRSHGRRGLRDAPY